MISGTWTGSTAESHASLFSKVRDRHTLPADTHETSKRTLPPDILQRRPGSFEFLTSDNINNGFSKFINVARHLSSLATFGPAGFEFGFATSITPSHGLVSIF